jgi:putative acetyltransferase
MSADGQIRPEAPGDGPAVLALHAAAFGQKAEAGLVDRLRTDGDLILSLVAVADGVVGHVAFSRLTLPAAPAVRACALAPLAVDPARQRRGIGSALVTEGLRRLSQAGLDLVLVLGEPAYYGRFGFTTQAAQALRTPYDGPYLQALALSAEGRAARGPVSYAGAFAELS